jgi:hypothetical protein
MDMAPLVAELMARELSQNAAWIEDQVVAFRALARNYLGQ